MEAVYETHDCPFCGEQANKVSAGYQEQNYTEFKCTDCGNLFKVTEPNSSECK